MKKGFIDPISLITLGFLVVGLVISTAIVKNPEKLDIRNWAKEIGDFGKVTPVKKTAPVIVPPPANSTVTTHGTVDTTPAVTTTNTVNSTIAPAAATPPPTTTQPTVTQPTVTQPTAQTTTTTQPKPQPPFVRCCPKDNSASAINTCTRAGESACNMNSSICEPLRSDNPNEPCPNLNPNNFVRCCPRDNSASAQTTCPGASEPACNINASVCQPLYSNNLNAGCGYTSPPALPPPAPNCGGQWEECCGQGYPNGSCNSGLYCSNLDGGTCRTRVCHAERKCEGNVLKICKADDSGWNNTTCQHGCVNNDCQAAPAPPPAPVCSLNCNCAAATYKGSTCSNGCGGVCPGTKCRTNGTACGTDASNCCTGFCNTSNVCAAKSSTDYPEEGRYAQQLIAQITQTCLQAGGDVCLSRKLCLSEEGKIISSSPTDCSSEKVCCSFPKNIISETVNSKEEKDSLTPTGNTVVPSPIAVFFSDQYHELPPSTYLPTQIVPTMIILHWDGQEGSPYGWTTNGTYKGLGFETSAHFAVGIDGVLQMLPMTNTTVARSQGAIGRNDQAINIEMAGWNFDGTPPTQKEIDAAVNLIIKLMQAYHLTINAVFGHSEQDTINSNGQACVMGVDPDCRDRYKSDPGKEFMDEIRKEVANRLMNQPLAVPAPSTPDTCPKPECITEQDCLLNYGQDYTCRVSFNPCQNTCILKQSPTSSSSSPETPETFVYYSQRDPQWEDAYFTCPDGTVVSFANSGCGETVTAMLLSTYVDSSYTPAAVKEEWFNHPNYCSGSGITTSNDILTANDFTIYKKVVSETILKEYIKAGWIGWVGITFISGNNTVSHHTLITGVDENGNFIFNDPWFGPNTTLEDVDFEIMGFEIIKPPGT